MTDCFNITCKGERHDVEDTPCQDYSLSMNIGNMLIAVVCDGHGAPQYFRSEKGSQFAAEAVMECISELADKEFRIALKGKPFTAYGPMRNKDVSDIKDHAYLTICGLVLNIIKRWDEKVKSHVAAHPLSDREAECIPEQLANAFRQGKVFNFAYGTTLLACVQTNEYWFAFQIGDGKILSVSKDIVELPVREDDACHDNITTSLCDNDALDEVRITYEGDGQIPDAFFCVRMGWKRLSCLTRNWLPI